MRRFFTATRSLVFIPLTALAIAASLSPNLPSPFIPVFAVVFAGLEAQFNNILFRTPREFDALSLFPVPWKTIVVAKNLATVIVTFVVSGVVAIPTLYFSPVVVTPSAAAHSLLYLATVIFPMLHAGNLRSVQRPRRNAGWRSDDVAEGFIAVATAGLLSLPYFLFLALPFPEILCSVYVFAMGFIWLRVSVTATATMIEKERLRLCMAT